MRLSRIISLMIALGALFTVPAMQNVHAQTVGTLCIVPVGWTACPVEPATLVGTVHGLMNVSITVQDSDSFDNYTIYVKPDYTELIPVGIQGGLVSAACANGTSVSGLPSACGPLDGRGIAHATYSGVAIAAPVTRLLFTITYRVVSGTGSDMLGYLQACSSSSVVGTSYCVSFSKGGTSLSENAPFSPFNTGSGPPEGVVCIVPTSATSCSQPYSFAGGAGSILTIAVDANVTHPMNGFDVSVKTDPSVLYPVAISYNGSVIPQPSFVDECINGALLQGPRCALTDGPGIAHLALAGPLAWMSNATIQGLFFTVTYRVLLNANDTIGFQTGCTSSSILNTGICVTLADGTIYPVPITIVDPAFTAAGSTGTVSLDKTLDLHSLRATSTGNLTLTYNPQNETITGKVSVTLTNTTSGSKILTKTFNVTITLPFGTRARFVMVIPTSSQVLAEACTLDQPAASSASCILIQDPDFTRTGSINIIDFAMIAYAYGATRGTTRYQPILDLAMDGTIDIIDAGIELAYYQATIIN